MSTSGASHSPLTPRHHLWRINVLVSTYVAYGGYYLTRKAFTISKTSIAEDLDWGLEVTGYVWTAFLFAYMLGQFINSFIGRKWGPRVILLGGLGLSIVFNAIFGFANSAMTFIVFMFFNGLVQASGWPGVVGGIAEWLRPKERGTIMGFWSTSYLIGNMVVKGVGGYLLGAWGWRWSFWGLTLITVGVWFVIYFFQRDRPKDVGLSPVIDSYSREGNTVKASQEEHVSFLDYLKLAFNPVILTMGMSYFCIKFLRYALDSWLPAFLNVQGMPVDQAAYYSGIFDMAGFAGAVVAGIALDRLFRGNWAMLCFIMGLGMIAGYVSVIQFGTSPYAIAWCFGIVGFMIYGPDTLLCGAASVQVAGERNGVAVAGLVNGIASIGPVIQEMVIAWLVHDDVHEGMRNTNVLALAMSILFTLFMLVMMWRLRRTHRQNQLEADVVSA